MSRFGGEEFALYLPAGLPEAEDIANKIRIAFATHNWTELGIAKSITASLGVSISHADDNSIHDVIKRADDALYTAKAAGRNRVARYPVSSESNIVPLRHMPKS